MSDSAIGLTTKLNKISGVLLKKTNGTFQQLRGHDNRGVGQEGKVQSHECCSSNSLKFSLFCFVLYV